MLRIFSMIAAAGLAVAIAVPAGPARADGDMEEGKKVFRKCMVCHDTAPGKHKLGPSLAGVFGRKAATAAGFRFSPALQKSGLVWDDKTLHAYLENPNRAVPGGRMAFAGLRSEKERADVIAYLKTLK